MNSEARLLARCRPAKRRRARIVAAALALAAGGCDLIDSAAEPTPTQAADKDAGALAFPGAAGHGRFAKGGRGGAILFVTTLDDSGPGSLRACIEAEGPRVCVFRVGGIIRYSTERPLIKNPFITIAGQTAPGDGVLLTHDGGALGLTPVAIKGASDVVIRHIRVRPDKIGERRNSNSGYIIEESRDVILDHVSSSWARDENFGGQGDNQNITVSWSIFAEGLMPHDKCALLSSDSRKPQNFSFLNNLCALNGDRNPDINFPPGSCIEVVNNVFYGATGEFAEVWESNGGSPVSIVGNVFRAGPKTPPKLAAITRWLIETRGNASIFADDNVLDGDLSEASENVAAVRAHQPLCPLTLAPARASDAYGAVLASAGAFPRDSFDEGIIRDVTDRVGETIDAPGHLPEIAGDAAPDDADNDGMADMWERISGIDDQTFNPWEDTDGDGWLNLDEYLDYMHRQRLQAGAAD
ncbi:MAG: polysaccharide lyase family 1 protein [Parvularculaceae bacterium]